jgi:hypothetical protein
MQIKYFFKKNKQKACMIWKADIYLCYQNKCKANTPFYIYSK